MLKYSITLSEKQGDFIEDNFIDFPDFCRKKLDEFIESYDKSIKDSVEKI